MHRGNLSIAGLLKKSPKTEAQGRLREQQPISIIDIGSNSVRQVIYEGLNRSPAVLFNEKLLCGLGRGVALTGSLEQEAMDRAIAAIRRFVALGRQAHVSDTHILATAAVREAENGSEFVARVEEVSGCKVNLLSGRMEAQYAALGIKSGFHRPSGIAGDLGGGSMELIEVNGDTANGATTPLGALRLEQLSGGKIDAASKIARKTLSGVNIRWPGESRDFYAIGGTWRNLARLHMLENDYPLDVIHDYRVNAKEYAKFCRQVANSNIDSLEHAEDISKNRRSLLPFGAIAMAECIKHLGVKTVIMSSTGLREGFLFTQLDEEVRQRDGLLDATSELCLLRSRSPGHSDELANWTGRAIEVLGLEETENLRRYRIAACNLSDIAWRSAFDFRAEQTLGIINNAGFTSISHEGRAFLALVNYHRYQGLGPKKQPPDIARLATENTVRLARILASFFRVLHLFSVSVEGVLPQLGFLRTQDGHLAIRVPKSAGDLAGERILGRLDQLGREIGEPVSIELTG